MDSSADLPRQQEQGELIKGVQDRQTRLEQIMFVVVAVLMVGFVTMLISVFDIFIGNETSAQQSYQNLQNQVQTQDTKIQVLTNQLQGSTVTTKP
jgi:cell division protein FtsL